MRQISVYILILLLLSIFAVPVYTQTSSTSQYYQNISVKVGSRLDLNPKLDEAKTELARNLFNGVNSIFNSDDMQVDPELQRARLDYSPALMGLKNQTDTAIRVVRGDGGELTEDNLHLLKYIDTHLESDTQGSVKINKQKLQLYISEETDKLKKKLKPLIDSAREREVSNPSQAVEYYQMTYPIYDALNKVVLLQHVVDSDRNHAVIRKELIQNITRASGELQMSYREVTQKVAKLERNKVPIMDESDNPVKTLAAAIARQLRIQRPNPPSGKVQVDQFTFEDNFSVPSPISYALAEALMNELPDWQFVPLNQRGFQRIPMKINGEIWMTDDDQVDFKVTLNRGDTGDQMGSAHVSTTQGKMRGMKIVPANLKQTRSHLEAFEDKLPIQKNLAPNSLVVDLATDQGADMASYKEGETMTVYCKVNQPAFIRLLYQLENGKYSVLYENFVIGPTSVNRQVEIDKFVCTPPFGTESLIVQASKEKFLPLKTTEEDGYYFLMTQVPIQVAKLLHTPESALKTLTIVTMPK